MSKTTNTAGTTRVVTTNGGAVYHITCGENDWHPTTKELDDIADLFMDALADPGGAVVVTRTGVCVTRITG